MFFLQIAKHSNNWVNLWRIYNLLRISLIEHVLQVPINTLFYQKMPLKKIMSWILKGFQRELEKSLIQEVKKKTILTTYFWRSIAYENDAYRGLETRIAE